MHDLPRQKIRELIRRFGTSLSEEPERCKGMLKDLCGEYRKEISALIIAMEEGIPSNIMSVHSGIPLSVVIGRLTQKLEGDRALASHAAQWAVESWALALQVATEAELFASGTSQAADSPRSAQVSDNPKLKFTSSRAQQSPFSAEPKSLLSGTTDVDYTELDWALQLCKWKKARELTLKLMCQAANRSHEGWLDSDSIRKFPGEDLLLIDRLWVEHSNGTLGFSVQKRIWQECGSPPPRYSSNESGWILFGKRVNWQGGNGIDGWRYYSELEWKDPQKHPGHLPILISEFSAFSSLVDIDIIWLDIDVNALFSRKEI